MSGRFSFVRLAAMAAILLPLPAAAQVRLGLELGSTRLGASELSSWPHALFDDATASYMGVEAMHPVHGRLSLGGSFTASMTQNGSDARILSALGEASWTFRPFARLQPHLDVGVGYGFTHNKHYGIQTKGQGLAADAEVGLRIGLGSSGRTGIDIGWCGLDIESRDIIAPNSTVSLGLSWDIGSAGRPRWGHRSLF